MLMNTEFFLYLIILFCYCLFGIRDAKILIFNGNWKFILIFFIKIVINLF